uniref:Uncharacterized protein n=1 Tax=Peronospora matthiolae TaxID=2874970 RepID=A0AAV1TKV6_9STRA
MQAFMETSTYSTREEKDKSGHSIRVSIVAIAALPSTLDSHGLHPLDPSRDKTRDWNQPIRHSLNLSIDRSLNRPTSMNTSTVETNETRKKHVRWGVVRVLEFHVGYNASVVPESGGPPVGLIGRPIRHRCSLVLPSTNDVEAVDSDCESVDSESDMETPLAWGCSRRSRSDLWLDPMERVRILVVERAFPMDDVALICQDVRATLDARASSRLDEAKAVQASLRALQQDTRLLSCGGRRFGSAREKVLLY